MVIRRAPEIDLAGILRVRGSNGLSNDPDPSPEYRYAMVHDTLLVADEDGELLGFGLLRGSSLDALYVLKEQQGRGIGPRILEELENIAKEQGYKTLQAYAFSPNPDDLEKLVQLYERLGFKKLLSDDRAAGVDMEKDLTTKN